VAVLTAALQDRRNILREGHRIALRSRGQACDNHPRHEHYCYSRNESSHVYSSVFINGPFVSFCFRLFVQVTKECLHGLRRQPSK
jgi:hypothetical protein